MSGAGLTFQWFEPEKTKEKYVQHVLNENVCSCEVLSDNLK